MSEEILGRWDRIAPILERALDLEPGERDAFVERECAGDSELLADLRRLLAAERSAGDFLDGPAGRSAATLVESLKRETEADAPAERLAPGGRIGRYRLVEEIGAGGMSRVYLAEREDSAYRQRVALKVMRLVGAHREERERRFRAERQMLAALEHPGIARILDGGISEDGREYLVMELVEGAPLDRYCEKRGLDLEARLRLFVRICEAVHYAHQRLIVHRDLKPSNIVVGATGEPKLLDFGIAKLLAESEATGLEGAPRTRTGLLLLTPEYAAPEQVQGKPVTTATDVWALGVMLYELVSGRRPFQLAGRSPSEIDGLLSRHDPPAPSSIAGGGAANLPRSGRRDLDAIVQKALEKEPERRYRSAAELADDLGRTLARRPVRARPATRAYRALRFVQRHRWGVATAAAVLLLVVAGGVALALEQRRTAAERNRARVEAETSRQIAAFLRGLFQASDPGTALGEEITARQLLESGRQRLAGMAGEPLVQAEMALVLGRVHQSLASYEHAQELFELALERRRERLGPASLATVEAQLALAELLRQRGEHERASGLLDEVSRRLELSDGESGDLRAEALLARGRLERDRGRPQEGLASYRSALEALRALGPAARERVGDCLTDIARVEQELGDYAASEASQREALGLWRELHPAGHPRVAQALNNLGLVESRTGDYAGAERHYRQALQLWDRFVEPAHPDRVGTLSNLGVVLDKAGDYPAALEAKQSVLELDRQVFGLAHPYVAMSLANLAITVENLGDLDRAEALKREAVAMREALTGREHPELATALNNLAVLLERKGGLEEAEALHRRALAIRRAAFGDRHPRVAESLHNLGRTLWRRGEVDEAERLLRDALARDRELHGPSHPRVASSLTTLGSLLSERGRAAEAGRLLEEGLAMRRELLGERHPDLAASLLAVAEHAGRNGEAARAAELFERAVALRAEVLGERHPLTVEAREVRAAAGYGATTGPPGDG